MALFPHGVRLRDEALHRVTKHIEARHPAAQPVYWNGAFGGLDMTAPWQLWIVGHGSKDGMLCETVHDDGPRHNARQMAALLVGKGLPSHIGVRIKLAQCFGGYNESNNDNLWDQPHAQPDPKFFGRNFARDLARLMNMAPYHYPQLTVGGFEEAAHWMGHAASKTAPNLVSTFSPVSSQGNNPHLSRAWFDNSGSPAAKARPAVAERVVVYFPFDFATS